MRGASESASLKSTVVFRSAGAVDALMQLKSTGGGPHREAFLVKIRRRGRLLAIAKDDAGVSLRTYVEIPNIALGRQAESRQKSAARRRQPDHHGSRAHMSNLDDYRGGNVFSTVFEKLAALYLLEHGYANDDMFATDRDSEALEDPYLMLNDVFGTSLRYTKQQLTEKESCTSMDPRPRHRGCRPRLSNPKSSSSNPPPSSTRTSTPSSRTSQFPTSKPKSPNSATPSSALWTENSTLRCATSAAVPSPRTPDVGDEEEKVKTAMTRISANN
ncbi:hypothetical protein BJ742DRAFT_771511 [Cladochytrium replicatum]|nr:hypothetical protein BJ742DRAFT_771511 [Cladochytrium replicatum]